MLSTHKGITNIILLCVVRFLYKFAILINLCHVKIVFIAAKITLHTCVLQHTCSIDFFPYCSHTQAHMQIDV